MTLKLIPRNFGGALAMETSLQNESWTSTKYPKISWQYVLEFEIQYAAVEGVCLNISELTGHRWDTTIFSACTTRGLP